MQEWNNQENEHKCDNIEKYARIWLHPTQHLKSVLDSITHPKRTHAICRFMHPNVNLQSWSSKVDYTRNVPKPISRLPGMYELSSLSLMVH